MSHTDAEALRAEVRAHYRQAATEASGCCFPADSSRGSSVLDPGPSPFYGAEDRAQLPVAACR